MIQFIMCLDKRNIFIFGLILKCSLVRSGKPKIDTETVYDIRHQDIGSIFSLYPRECTGGLVQFNLRDIRPVDCFALTIGFKYGSQVNPLAFVQIIDVKFRISTILSLLIFENFLLKYDTWTGRYIERIGATIMQLHPTISGQVWGSA